MNPDNRRVSRVENEIQRIVSQFVINRIQGISGGLLTVTRVQMPKDLKTARVYVSFMDFKSTVNWADKLSGSTEGIDSETSEDSQVKTSVKNLREDKIKWKEILSELQSHAPEMQRLISHQVRMRNCPRLQFFQDESAEKVLKVERLLYSIRGQAKGAQRAHSSDDLEAAPV